MPVILSFTDNIIPTAGAFFIGTVFGALVGLALMGEKASLAQARTAVIRSALGSAIGAGIFLVTASWWPSITGPFLTCPATAIAVAVLFKPR